MKVKRIVIMAVSVVILTMSYLSWAAETIQGFFVEFKNDTIEMRRKGGGKVSVRVSDKTYVRNIQKGETSLSLLPKNSKLYVVVENSLATIVTIEEVPQ